MSIIQGNAHTSAGGGYNIERSLRFNSADTAYLNRTLSSSGNRKTWTWSGWVKGFTTGNALFGAAGSSGGQGAIYFSNSSIVLYEYSVEVSAETFNVKSSAVYRDPAAWYHIVAAFDTTQATASNRIKLYVNGVQITAFATANYPSLNLDAYNINNSTKRALLGTENYGGKVKKMASGGLAAGHKSADGVATKGKTKAMQVKMAKGGMTKMRKGGYC